MDRGAWRAFVKQDLVTEHGLERCVTKGSFMTDWGQNVEEKQASWALVRPFLNYLCPVRRAVRLQKKRVLLSCPLGAFSVAPLQVHHCVCSLGVSELKVECLPPCLNSLISDFVFIIICAFVF